MPSKSSSVATTSAPTPQAGLQPPPSPGTNWVAIAAFFISLFSLAKSFWTDHRGHQARLASEFEATYGGPIRISLRQFEKRLGTLRAITLPSGRSLEELKAEIENLRPEWEDAAGEVTTLLAEVDKADCLHDKHWAACFEGHTQQADVTLQSVWSPAISDVPTLSQRAAGAFDHYRSGIEEIRSRLRAQAASYSKRRPRA